MRWDAEGLAFESRGDDALRVLCGDGREWAVDLGGKKDLVAWLATYLHAFLPGGGREYF